MAELATTRRNEPAPPWVLYEALRAPNSGSGRSWLVLAADEVWPQPLAAASGEVIWSSIWPAHPTARIRFELPSDGGGGTDLRWTLLIDEPHPPAEVIRALRHRINYLVNDALRRSFGQ